MVRSWQLNLAILLFLPTISMAQIVKPSCVPYDTKPGCIGVSGVNWYNLIGLAPTVNWGNSTFINLGLNWDNITNFSTNGINWNNLKLFNAQINWDSIVNIGNQTINWSDHSLNIANTNSLYFGNDQNSYIKGSALTTADLQVFTNSSGDSSTGGSYSTNGSYHIRTFTSSGTFTPGFTGTVNVLVVAGGAGGGTGVSTGNGAGGGGAGGITNNTSYSVTNGTPITVTIGAGGASGANGNNSVFGTITTNGGGTGSPGGNNVAGSNGGSGGGGGGSGSTYNNPYGTGIGGQGYHGGYGNPDGSGGEGGGGGGSAAVGSDSTINTSGGAGGSGTSYSISGSSVYYGAGGGGGGGYGAGAGGTGGGGAGGHSGVGSNATTYGSGGGGGGSPGTNAGGTGYQGIVIISYIPSGVTETARFTQGGNLVVGKTSTSLTGAGNVEATGTIEADTAVNTPAISNLTTNGVVTTSGGNGTLNIKPLLIGTLTDGKGCTYASSGTLLNCNTTLATGTVTSVATDSTMTGGPITTSGTLGVNLPDLTTLNLTGINWSNYALLNGTQSFTGEPTFNNATPFAVGNNTLISNLNAQYWNSIPSVQVSVSLAGVAGDTTNIGSWTVTPYGGQQLWVTLQISNANIVQTKTYFVNTGYGIPASWRQMDAIATSGPYSTADVALDVEDLSGVTYLRLRCAGTNAGTVLVTMMNFGNAASTFTASSTTATGVSAPTLPWGSPTQLIAGFVNNASLYTNGYNMTLAPLSAYSNVLQSSSKELMENFVRIGDGSTYSGVSEYRQGRYSGASATTPGTELELRQANTTAQLAGTLPTIMSWTAQGYSGVNTETPTASWFVTPVLTTDIAMIIKAVSSQTADLLDFDNSSGSVLASVDHAGNFTTVSESTGNITASGHIVNSGATCATIGPVGTCWTSTGQLGYCSGVGSTCGTCTAC